ncbi:MAG: ATP12 family protein [Bdellovibrionales bacterium]
MKRFYTLVSTQKTDQGFLITLDGRPVKTAMKHELLAPNEKLANALVKEWAGQEDKIIPDSMPMTQILSTKIDRVSHERNAMQAAMFKYLDTDLLCYRADDPPELKNRQKETWDQYLDWFKSHYEYDLKTTYGLAAITQEQGAHDKIHSEIKAMNDDDFTLLQLIVSISGSLILGLAAMHKKANAEDIFTAMRVEETFKAEIYNEDFYGSDPAQEAKDKAIQADLKATLEYLKILK